MSCNRNFPKAPNEIIVVSKYAMCSLVCVL